MDGAKTADEYGVEASNSLDLPYSFVNPDEMASFLESVARFANSSGAQNAATVLAVVQATMGPWKFAFNLAAKAALDATVGDEIDQKNEEAAIALVARWKDLDSTKIAQLNEDDKARHANGEKDVPFEGSTDVVGVKYLIESVEQEVVGGVGKASGRAIGVVGGKVPQITINRQNGVAFERQVIASFSHVGGSKNTTPITVQLPDGRKVTTIPDMWGSSAGGLLEIKNVKYLSMSDQIRAQVKVAIDTGEPMNLVVSPRTGNISSEVVRQIRSTGGDIFKYNPATGELARF